MLEDIRSEAKRLGEWVGGIGFVGSDSVREAIIIFERFMERNGIEAVKEKIHQLNPSFKPHNPLAYLTGMLKKIQPEVKPESAKPEPEPFEILAAANGPTEEETCEGTGFLFDDEPAEETAHYEPVHYKPVPEEQIVSEIELEEKDARRRALAASTWREDGLEDYMLGLTESAYEVDDDLWKAFYEHRLEPRYRNHPYAEVRRLAIQEGTSMHEECRKLGLKYDKLIYTGFGLEPISRKGVDR